MKTLVHLHLKLAFLVPATLASQSPQWGDLRPGAFAAGFRMVETFDRGRTEGPAVDFRGKRDTVAAGVPMQLGIWYPAVKSAQASPMRHFDLALATLHRERFGPRTVRDTADTRREVAQIVRLATSDTSQIEAQVSRTLTQLTASYASATPARGSFPVAVIAAGGWLGGTTVLAEYLASHGWMVVATAGQTARSGAFQVNQPALAVDAGVNAIAFAVAHASALPGADLSRLSLIGVNFDSFSALEYQMRHMRASAVVTINGWETIEDRAAVLRASAWYEPTRLRVPMLNIHWDQPGSAPANRRFLEELKYAERRSFVIEGLDHSGLILNPLSVTSVSAQVRLGHQYLIRAVTAVLTRANGGSDEQFVERAPAAVGFSGVVLKDSWSRAALPAVPTRAEFFDIIGNRQDLTMATQIYREARGRDSTAQLFSEGDMNLASFRFQRAGRLGDAVAVQQLSVDAYPASHLARNGLGNARLAAADTAGAVREFESALALLDANPTLSAADKATQAGIWRAKIQRLRP